MNARPNIMSITELPADYIARSLLVNAGIAATWWADRMRDGRGIGDNGATGGPGRENHAPSVAAMSLSLMANRDAWARGDLSMAKIDAFETGLTLAIVRVFEEPNAEQRLYRDVAGWTDGGPDLRLHVDYHPDRLLYDALIAAGIPKIVADMFALPLKSSTWISARRVAIRGGYGGETVEARCAWGVDLDHHRLVELARYDAEEAACREPLEALYREVLGERWTYRQVEESGLPRMLLGEEWQGPIREHP